MIYTREFLFSKKKKKQFEQFNDREIAIFKTTEYILGYNYYLKLICGCKY